MTTMAIMRKKPLLLSFLCASLFLISRAASRSLKRFISSSPQQRHQLSSNGMQGWESADDARSIDDTDHSDSEVKNFFYLRANGFAYEDNNLNFYPTMSAFDGTNSLMQDMAEMAPLRVCERKAPVPHEIDMRILRKYARCPLLNHRPPDKTTILLLSGMQTFGRTGNNLIEFLHSLQYGRDQNVLVAIVYGSWAPRMITDMWMAIQADSDQNRAAWREFVEQAFCVKILDDAAEAKQYRKVIQMDTRDIFMYKHDTAGFGLLNRYAEFQGHIIRDFYRFYNDGNGINTRRLPVQDMCSVLDTMFGVDKRSVVYSVIHSRSLEGAPGLRLLGRIARYVGCDPVAALDMEPEYIKAILEPLGMLDKPIVFITDHQRPEILEKLLADPDIGRSIRFIPEEASWVGGDITVATMADVFIGNPASSFSGFIAKSRVALGYDTNYLFRRKNDNGEWVDVCDERCIFDSKAMSSMA
ncbi:hypothetical protein ACHAXR_004006 [Thalassiosira sp. AJA248-18]